MQRLEGKSAVEPNSSPSTTPDTQESAVHPHFQSHFDSYAPAPSPFHRSPGGSTGKQVLDASQAVLPVWDASSDALKPGGHSSRHSLEELSTSLKQKMQFAAKRPTRPLSPVSHLPRPQLGLSNLQALQRLEGSMTGSLAAQGRTTNTLAHAKGCSWPQAAVSSPGMPPLPAELAGAATVSSRENSVQESPRACLRSQVIPHATRSQPWLIGMPSGRAVSQPSPMAKGLGLNPGGALHTIPTHASTTSSIAINALHYVPRRYPAAHNSL